MRHILLTATALLLLSACGSSPASQETSQNGSSNVLPAAKEAKITFSDVDDEVLSKAPELETMTTPDQSSRSVKKACSDEIGQAAAEKLVATCRNVSPATRPPCNVVNSCAIIRDEIARGKAFIAQTDIKSEQGTETSDQRTQAGLDVIQRYYSAINRRDFGEAYALWGEDGQASGKSRTAFNRGFSHTSSAEVTIGDVGRPQGAVGSIYLSVPVTVISELEDGTRQRFIGTYVLRRANYPSVPAADREWRISSAKLTLAKGGDLLIQ